MNELAAAIYLRHRAHLRELRIEPVDGGFALSGRSGSFYGKQMAQQEVIRVGLVVASNSIVVVSPTLASPAIVFLPPKPIPEPTRPPMSEIVHPRNLNAVQFVEAVGVSAESWRDACRPA